MLVVVTSVKGSPGATSTALALAGCWPRDVVLVEADPAGGDLAYRCAGADGRMITADRSVLSLAAEVRSGVAGPDTLISHTLGLANGTALVQGVTSKRQGDALAPQWAGLIRAVKACSADVIVDLGRAPAPATTPSVADLLRSADIVLVVTRANLESVGHLVADLPHVTGSVGALAGLVWPVIISSAARPEHDLADVDDLLAAQGTRCGRGVFVPVDAKTLKRLENGDRADGKLLRTPLVRQVRQLAAEIVAGDAAAAGPARATSPTAPAHITATDSPHQLLTGSHGATPTHDRGSRWLAPRTGGAS